MNERIQELMAEARAPFSKTGSYFTQELLMEKFAELLIRECIMLLYEDDGATHHEELIKEHFGVKE
jgi:hypothetical protein